jgi:hypothetical protein
VVAASFTGFRHQVQECPQIDGSFIGQKLTGKGRRMRPTTFRFEGPAVVQKVGTIDFIYDGQVREIPAVTGPVANNQRKFYAGYCSGRRLQVRLSVVHADSTTDTIDSIVEQTRRGRMVVLHVENGRTVGTSSFERYNGDPRFSQAGYDDDDGYDSYDNGYYGADDRYADDFYPDYGLWRIPVRPVRQIHFGFHVQRRI